MTRDLLLIRAILATLDDWFLGVQAATANRAATMRQRSKARMYGELFALTGTHVAGWPYRYLSDYVDGESAVC
jgi:hypothetical protein